MYYSVQDATSKEICKQIVGRFPSQHRAKADEASRKKKAARDRANDRLRKKDRAQRRRTSAAAFFGVDQGNLVRLSKSSVTSNHRAMKLTLKNRLLRWARERAGMDEETLARKIFGKHAADPERVKEWERTGEVTYSRAEKIAEKTHTPFGFLFLDEPPEEKLPIQDFRTVGTTHLKRPSPDLLDVIYECQRRQAWFREYLVKNGKAPLEWLGKHTVQTPIETTAHAIRTRIKIGAGLSTTIHSWRDNLTTHFEAAEESGILVMRNGVVGNNGSRALDVAEFRGFALYDEYAPLVFINTRDAKAAQLFTLVHEIAHIFLGVSALSNTLRTYSDGAAIETYCNQVAAEVLVPKEALIQRWRAVYNDDPFLKIRRLAGEFKVSTLVLARRSKDAGFITNKDFEAFYEDEIVAYLKIDRPKKAEGEESSGNFHNTLRARAGSRFCNALIANTLAGTTAYTQAFRLLGIKGTDAFHNFAKAKFAHLMR